MARKWIAGGNIAEGFLVFANVGSGVVTFGNVAHGLFAFGNLAVGGVFAVGNVAVAPIAIGATNAIGVLAFSAINALPFVWGIGGLNLLTPPLGLIVAVVMLVATFVVKGERPASLSDDRPVVDVGRLLHGEQKEGWVAASFEPSFETLLITSGKAQLDASPELIEVARAIVREKRSRPRARVRAEFEQADVRDYRDAQPGKVRLTCVELDTAPDRPMWWEDRRSRYWVTGWCWRVAIAVGLVAWVARIARVF